MNGSQAISAIKQRVFDEFNLSITAANSLYTVVTTVGTVPVQLGPLPTSFGERRRRMMVQNTSAVTVTVGATTGGYAIPPGADLRLPVQTGLPVYAFSLTNNNVIILLELYTS